MRAAFQVWFEVDPPDMGPGDRAEVKALAAKHGVTLLRKGDTAHYRVVGGLIGVWRFRRDLNKGEWTR